MTNNRSGCMPYTMVTVQLQVADLSHKNFKWSHEEVT